MTVERGHDDWPFNSSFWRWYRYQEFMNPPRRCGSATEEYWRCALRNHTKEKSAWDIGEGERNDAMRMKLPEVARKCMHPISSWFRPLCLYHTQRTAKCGTRSRNVQKPLCHSCPSLNGYALKLLCLTSANGNQEKLPNGYNAIGQRLCFSVCTGISKYVDDAIDVIVSTS